MVHSEGTVEAISVGFEHSTAPAVNFTLNNASLLCYITQLSSRGCVNAHVRQLIASAG